MTPAAEQFFDVAAPRLHVVAQPTVDRLPYAWPVTTLPDGAVSRRVRCKKMRTVAGLFDEFAAAFQFPPYFGENWAALEECLTDLEWIGGHSYLAILWDAHELLADAGEDDLRIFVRMLDRVAAVWSRPVKQGEPWDRSAIPFHVVFVVPEEQVERFSARLTGLTPSR